MAYIPIRRLYVWSRRPVEWITSGLRPYFGSYSLLPYFFFNRKDRHTNIFLCLPALWSKSWRLHALEMHGFMECSALRRGPSRTLPPRLVVYLPTFSWYYIGTGLLWINLCAGIFTHRPHYRFETILYHYPGPSWWSWWKRGSWPTPRLVEQVSIMFKYRSCSNLFIQANFSSLRRPWTHAFEEQCALTDQAEVSGNKGCQVFCRDVGLGTISSSLEATVLQ